jgi:hypothetical protein
MEKLSTFLLEIITQVSSANKMGFDKVFIVGGRSFIYMMKTRSLQLTPGERHVSLSHILRKISQLVLFN